MPWVALFLCLVCCSNGGDMFGRRARLNRRGIGAQQSGIVVAPPEVTVSLGSAISATAHGNRTNWTPSSTNVLTDPVARSGNIRQFVVWYDSQPSNSKITIGRRTRPEAELTNWSAWTTQTASVTNPGAISDAHFFPSIGIRDTDGVAFLVWRAHNLDTAFRWVGADIDDITVDHNDAVFTSQGVEDTSTYWRFLYQHDGTLFYTHRVGAAGSNAQQIIARSNGTDFTLLHTGTPNGFIDFPAGGDEESPYMDRPCRNPVTGRWHWSWIWARGGDLTTYHDRLYIYSDDDNDTFRYIDGSAVTLPVGSPATHPKSVAFTIAEDSGMPVHHCTTATEGDQPIMTWYQADPDDTTKTNIHVGTYYQGAWRDRIIYRQQGYSLVGDTDPPQPMEITNIMCLHKDGVTFVWYANTFLGPGFWVQCSRDPGLERWSEPVQLINVTNDYGSAVLDDSAWQHFGEIYMYVQEDNGALAQNYVARVTLE